MAQSPKRRELLSMTRTQLKLVAIVCLPMILACIAISFLQIYFFLSTLHARGVFENELAKEIIPIASYITGIVLIILLSTCFALAVIVGHRIVGPMRRFASRLADIGEGRLCGGFYMRQKDDLAFVGVALTEMERNLAQRLRQCRDVSNQIAQAVDHLKVATMSGDAIQPLMKDLDSAAATLLEQLNAFTLGDEPAADAEEPAAEEPKDAPGPEEPA